MGRALFLRHLICRTLRGTAQEEGRLSARYIPERVPQTTNSATFLSRPSNDKFQAGRHHPYMGVFERVNRFLFDRECLSCSSRVSHRAPRTPDLDKIDSWSSRRS